MHVLKSALAFIPAVLMSGAVHAENLSYTHGEVGYASVDGEIGGVDFDGDGFGLNGSLAVAENVFLTAGYASTEVDFDNSNVDAEFDSYSLGIGAHIPLQENLDLVGTLSWVKVDVEDAGNDDGVQLGVGLRGMATDQLEWGAGIDYTDIDDEGDFGFTVSGRYHFTPELSAGIALNTDDNADVLTTTASVRYELR